MVINDYMWCPTNSWLSLVRILASFYEHVCCPGSVTHLANMNLKVSPCPREETSTVHEWKAPKRKKERNVTGGRRKFCTLDVSLDEVIGPGHLIVSFFFCLYLILNFILLGPVIRQFQTNKSTAKHTHTYTYTHARTHAYTHTSAFSSPTRTCLPLAFG